MTKKTDEMGKAIREAVAQALRENGIGKSKTPDDKPIHKSGPLTESDWVGCKKPCSLCRKQKDIIKGFGFTLRRSHLTPQSRCIQCRAEVNYRGLKRVYSTDGGDPGEV